jgi:hypothetical protein
MGLLQEALLGRLGSRFSMNFRPKERKVYLSPMGRFYDQPVELGIGLRLNEKTYILPFADTDKAEVFSCVEQEFMVEGIEYKTRDHNLGLEFTCRIHAPFYPEDQKISSAPFFYVDLKVESYIHGRNDFQPFDGEWHFSLSGARIDANNNMALTVTSKLDKNCWYYSDDCPPELHFPYSENMFSGEVKVSPLHPGMEWRMSADISNVYLSKPFSMKSPKEIVEETLIISGFQPNNILQAWHKNCRFQYTDYFKNIDAVIEYARSEHNLLLQKTDHFTHTIVNSSISPSAKSLIACGFQNYLANTWWVLDDNHEDWFFVWEGWCCFHSTLDVEYNNSWFSLLYWPELLEKQIKAWFRNIQPEGFPSHDIGVLLEVNSQVYPHHMPVEECCNLLLLIYALWRFRGYQDWQQYSAQIIKVVDYLVAADTTGNGYPNIGVENTVDDAAASIQYAKEQTYLAVKVVSALTAFIELTPNLPGSESLTLLLQKSKDMIAKIKNTMDSEAWLDDHYAVCLPQSTEGLRDLWTGKEITGSELNGWDAYSLYTSNGLLLLLATGIKPDLNYERLTVDLKNSLDKSLTPYGCTHSSVDRSNVWLSQNFWRDQVASYLGLDLLDMTDCYWKFLEMENIQGRGGCFVDTYGWNWLSYYPRGVTMIGIIASALGMRINMEKKEINFSPVRLPCRFPLTILADWENGAVPWVECWMKNGKMLWQLEGQIPAKWRVNMDFGMLATTK